MFEEIEHEIAFRNMFIIDDAATITHGILIPPREERTGGMFLSTVQKESTHKKDGEAR